MKGHLYPFLFLPTLIFSAFLLLNPVQVLAEDLHSISSIHTGGLTINQGDTVFRSDLTSISPYWSALFTWPETVSNSKAVLIVFHGTFGHLSDGAPQEGVNMSIQNQAWGSGLQSIQKQFFPSLGDLSTPGGTYTFLIAQLPDTAYTAQDLVKWFASGGATSTEPVHYSTLSFTYNSTNQPQQLAGALISVQNSRHTFIQNDSINQSDLFFSGDQFDLYWNFRFNWPNNVANQNALFMVFKGTYGNVPGALSEGTNYSYNFQAFPGPGEGTIGKYIGLPALAASTTQPGTYTAMIAERDPKTSGSLDTTEALWFASGGTSGIPPKKYSTLTFTVTKKQTCCSSVFFLPGFEGSRLYTDGLLGSENQVWEPNLTLTQSDVKKLALDSSGVSINKIYTKSGDVIGEAGGFEIYKTFLQQLDSLKSTNAISGYTPFAYDWRMSARDIVENGTSYKVGFHYPSQDLEQLAAQSVTGKVTIVAHSNGGLIAKALMQKLEREGKSNLVDKIIFVGVPQLGSVSALAAMLHGDEQNLDYVLSKQNVRYISEYMPSAYGLLPSTAYFGKVVGPVVSGTTTLDLLPSLASLNGVVTSSNTLKSFVSDGSVRTKPAFSDIETPNLLSSNLFDSASTLHQSLDTWIAPQGVQVIQIAGWGLDTASGITYFRSQKRSCPLTGAPCVLVPKLRHLLTMTEDGDARVVTPSAVINPFWDTYYIEAFKYDIEQNKNYKHASITDIPPFQALFSNLLASSTLTLLPQYVQSIKPTSTNSNKKLRIRMLSPVSLDAYDGLARHTGLIKNPVSEFFLKEENIPNSYYEEFGEGKYIGLHADGNYRIELKGLDQGTFTFEVSTVEADRVMQTVSYTDVPVTASSTGSFSIANGNLNQSSLTLDIDGDGRSDLSNATSTVLVDPLIYVRLIRTAVSTMNLGTKTKRQLLAKLYNTEQLIIKSDKWDDEDVDGREQDPKKGKKTTERISNKVDKISTFIQKRLEKSQKSNQKEENISLSNAENLLNMLDTLKRLVQ